jgi:hypothetical protein
VQSPQLTSTGGDAWAPTGASRTHAVLGEQVWRREMNRLRRLGVLLIIALGAVIARIAIDGAKLLGVLTGALILSLLLGTLALMRKGARLRQQAEPDDERGDAR